MLTAVGGGVPAERRRSASAATTSAAAATTMPITARITAVVSDPVVDAVPAEAVTLAWVVDADDRALDSSTAGLMVRVGTGCSGSSLDVGVGSSHCTTVPSL